MNTPTPSSAPLLRWLPWLLTVLAFLAALCLAQLYFLSRTENALLRDQLALADTTAAALRNQLESERLLARHPLPAEVPRPAPVVVPVKRN